MANCAFCNKKIESNAPFILEGFFPSLLKRYFNFDFYSLKYYGESYHKVCYLKKIGSRSQSINR